MTWGIPPTYEIEKQFNLSNGAVLTVVKKSLLKLNYTLGYENSYTLEARKKMRFGILSLFSLERSYLMLFITITKEGKLTIRSSYNYLASHISPVNDKGRSNVLVTKLLQTIEEEVKITN